MKKPSNKTKRPLKREAIPLDSKLPGDAAPGQPGKTSPPACPEIAMDGCDQTAGVECEAEPTTLVPSVSGLPCLWEARNSEAIKLWFRGGELQSSQPLSSGLGRAFGTEDAGIKVQTLNEIRGMVPNFREDVHDNLNAELNGGLATINELAPRDAQDRSLAVQLWAVGKLAMKFYAKVGQPGQTAQQVDGHINRATKLTRSYCALSEALDRHRGKSPQPVVVGNVNVGNGGQAIVGSVSHSASQPASKEED